MIMYYVYVDKTDKGAAFYVGKGNEARVKMLRGGRNGKHGSVCRNHGQHREIVFSHEDEETVLNEEVRVIDALHTWVHDPLSDELACNFVREGRGWSKTGTQCERISECTKIGMAKIPPEERAKQKERQRRAMMGHSVSDEARQRQSEAQRRRKDRGDLFAFFSAGGKSRKGHKHKTASIELMCQNRRGKCMGIDHPMKREENRHKASIRMMGHPVSDETRRRIGLAKSKLTSEQRCEIIRLFDEGVRKVDLQRRFNVSKNTIRRVIDHGR